MTRPLRWAMLTLLVWNIDICAQQRTRRGRQPADSGISYNMPAVTFRGELKEITSKAVIMQTEDGQIATIYRNHKTRFLQAEQNVDPKKIAIGAELTVDVSKNPDGSLLALNVMVGKPAAEPASGAK